MKKQQSLTDYEYSCRKKTTKREEFLEIMDEIIPWDEWVGIIAPYYPAGKRGRPPMGIERMLRMYLLQIWFNLSDPATEDAIYDSYAMRKFTDIDFMTENVPDETTLCKFRHLLEVNGLNKLFFDAINRVMVATGHMMKGGTIVDATIINAPSSTKNAEKVRDPEMHQTKKGNEWRFGMKCHAGVDAFSGLVHTIEVTAANEHDVTVAAKLIREDDEVVYGDSGYLGIQKRPEVREDAHLSAIDYRINRRPHSLPTITDNAVDWERLIEHRKSSVRCKVEHVFRIIKCQFGYTKTRYRGLKKNENRLYAMFACANLYVLARAGRKLNMAW
jgi:transposase, IS5 family